MQEFILKNQPLFIDFHNDGRYGKAYIEDKDGNRLKTIILDVSYEYVVFKLGKEFLDDLIQMQKWLDSQIESVFKEYKVNPASFKSSEIRKIFRN